MLTLKKIYCFTKNNLNKNYLLVFVSVFSFITALGTLYSIYNSADSNPKLVWFFLVLGLVSFFILFISISKEILKLIKNIIKLSKIQCNIKLIENTMKLIEIQ